MTLLAQYHLQTRRATRWQFGLGLASHRGVRLTEESAGFRDELDLDSTIGWHVAVGVQWYATKRYGVELDVFYESIRHEVPSSDIGVDASSLGLSLRFVTNVL